MTWGWGHHRVGGHTTPAGSRRSPGGQGHSSDTAPSPTPCCTSSAGTRARLTGTSLGPAVLRASLAPGDTRRSPVPLLPPPASAPTARPGPALLASPKATRGCWPRAVFSGLRNVAYISPSQNPGRARHPCPRKSLRCPGCLGVAESSRKYQVRAWTASKVFIVIVPWL